MHLRTTVIPSAPRCEVPLRLECKRREACDDARRQKERLDDYRHIVKSDEDSNCVGFDHRESSQQYQISRVLPALDEERKEETERCYECDHQEPSVLVDQGLTEERRHTSIKHANKHYLSVIKMVISVRIFYSELYVDPMTPRYREIIFKCAWIPGSG